jgi:acetate---CoA ligase (ADP-forming) subunit beta
VSEIITKAKKEGRVALTEVEAKELLAKAGINVAPTKLATTKQEAASTAKALGFPVVLKIVSPDVLHKSDAGGVKLNLNSEAEVSAAFDAIMTSIKAKVPNAKILGVAVQKMARPGTEVIIGMSKDPQFGPVLMFGLGGIFVEIMKDVSFRIVPLTKRDADEMIREIKGFPVLTGYRGGEVASLAQLQDMLLKVSEFAEKNPEVKELDLNPVLAYKDGAIAVDARVILEK